jgi:nitrate reductase gamma subunit
LRPYSTGAALFNLVFLLAVFVSGYLALMTSGDFSGNILVFFQGLLSANNTFTVPVPLAAHLILVCLFLAYLPFTPMLHFVAKYFTYHRIRWDDAAMTPGSRTERQVLELLKQPVTWASAHLQADGHKNWVDIASPKVEE